jgi:hypothetical protein
MEASAMRDRRIHEGITHDPCRFVVHRRRTVPVFASPGANKEPSPAHMVCDVLLRDRGQLPPARVCDLGHEHPVEEPAPVVPHDLVDSVSALGPVMTVILGCDAPDSVARASGNETHHSSATSRLAKVSK